MRYRVLFVKYAWNPSTEPLQPLRRCSAAEALCHDSFRPCALALGPLHRPSNNPVAILALPRLEPAAPCASNMAREADLPEYAISLLPAAETAGGGDALGDARDRLRTGDARSAADALISIGNVAKNCDKEVLAAVKAAERAARDVVVLHCGGGVLNRDAFLEAAGVAFAHRGIRLGDEENRELRAVLLLAYFKLRRELQPAR